MVDVTSLSPELTASFIKSSMTTTRFSELFSFSLNTICSMSLLPLIDMPCLSLLRDVLDIGCSDVDAMNLNNSFFDGGQFK